MTEQWFYAKGDRREGPFTFDQLKWLASNNRIQRTDLAWREGIAEWLPAGEVSGLFAASQPTPIQPPPPPRALNGSQEAPSENWYHSRDGVQSGPLSTAHLRESAANGQILPTDHVWKEGMAGWIEAREVSGLFAETSSPPPPPPRQIQMSTPSAAPTRPTSSSAIKLGTIVVHRKPKLTGFRHTVKIWTDGQPVGEIPGSLPDLLSGQVRELEFHLPVGAHRIEATGGGLSGFLEVQVSAEAVNLFTYFSKLGVLGSSLIISDEEPPQRHVQTAMPQTTLSPQAAPALWNPMGTRGWSLLLSWGFGSYLTAQNWMALGEIERANRSMRWFYSSIAFLLLAVFSPDSPPITALFRLVGTGAFIAWALLDSVPHAKYIKERFGATYPRKRWLKPLGIGTACVVGLLFVAAVARMKSTGSISFAEHVDRATLTTQNEGTVFTTGWVAMIVRGNEPFGDSQLVITYRKSDEQMWNVLNKHTVAPDWDTLAVPIYLNEPGDYSIVVRTSTGRLVAENDVEILP